MAYEIKWSDPAQDEIHEIINYLLEEWGDKVAEQLSEQILEISELLANHPYAGRRHEILKAVREFRVKPYYLLYYTVIESRHEILVLDFVDSRKRNH
jgi:addiction module RelE/StbE family toxin